MLYVAPVGQIRTDRLLFVTKSSMCKLVEGAEFDVAKRTIASTKLAEDDELIFIGSASEMEQIVLQSHGGCFLRFLKQEISTMKKTATWCAGNETWQTMIIWNMHTFWQDIRNIRSPIMTKNIP